jgi:pSer/pThr/pTyr-binding forkhead associated (FHA) protein
MFLLTIETKNEIKVRKTIKTKSSSLTLGRDRSCQIVLRNTYFSRIHATLTDQENGSWLVSDGGTRKPSTTGLSIEGRKVIGSALLFEGQILTLIDQLNDIPVMGKAPQGDPEAGPSTQLLTPIEPIRATLVLLPAEEIEASRDVTLSGVRNNPEIESTRINQRLLALIDKSDEMPKIVEEFRADLFDRLLALETDKASAAMVDQVLTSQLQAVKEDYASLTATLKRKLNQFEGKYRVVLGILLLMLVLKLGEGYAPEELKSWVELAEKALPLIALFQEMRSKR